MARVESLAVVGGVGRLSWQFDLDHFDAAYSGLKQHHASGLDIEQLVVSGPRTC
jgi:hypothetical protein